MTGMFAGALIQLQAGKPKVIPPGGRPGSQLQGWKIAATKGGRDNNPHRKLFVTDGRTSEHRRLQPYTYKLLCTSISVNKLKVDQINCSEKSGAHWRGHHAVRDRKVVGNPLLKD